MPRTYDQTLISLRVLAHHAVAAQDDIADMRRQLEAWNDIAAAVLAFKLNGYAGARAQSAEMADFIRRLKESVSHVANLQEP